MSQPTEDHTPPHGDRFASIDALRGSAVLIWGLATTLPPLLISLPESGWRTMMIDLLSPSIWHGITLYDWMLPAFLMALGAAVVFDIDARRKGGADSATLVKRVVWRAVLLFAIGLVCEGFRAGGLADMRWTGVFQRIAVCYLAAGLFGIFSGWRIHAITVAVIMLEYVMMMELIEVPGYEPGSFSVEGNAAAYLDRLWLPGRMYFTSWDPQGLFSTLPAIASTMIGMLLGRHLLEARRSRQRHQTAYFVIGLCALNGGLWADHLIPVNAYINTPTFVLASSGAAVMVVAGANWIAASRLSFLLTPLTALGRNALLLMIVLAAVPQLPVSGVWLLLIAAVLAALWLRERQWFLTLSRVVPGSNRRTTPAN